MTFNTLGYTTVQKGLGSLFLRGFVVCVAAISKFPWALEKNPVLRALPTLWQLSFRWINPTIGRPQTLFFICLVAEKYAQK